MHVKGAIRADLRAERRVHVEMADHDQFILDKINTINRIEGRLILDRSDMKDTKAPDCLGLFFFCAFAFSLPLMYLMFLLSKSPPQ
jgi:hypothetical protein